MVGNMTKTPLTGSQVPLFRVFWREQPGTSCESDSSDRGEKIVSPIQTPKPHYPEGGHPLNPKTDLQAQRG